MLAPSNDIKLNVTINVGGTDTYLLECPGDGLKECR